MAIQEEMRINRNHLPVLPTDITIDILSWLSVESVLSCKRVCKTWRALIDDPAFAQAHTYRFLLDDEKKKQQQKPEAFEFFLSPHDVFLSPDDTDIDKYNFGEHTHGDITFKLHKSITHDYPFPLNNSRSHWRPVSSCNGLICLVSKVEVDYYNSYICVYNPLTREYVNLPILTYEPPLVRGGIPLRHIKTGFGYHPCTKEYKVVQIYYYNIDDDSSQGQVSVYTLGSGSGSSSGWRSKGEIDFKLSGRDLLVNGALHWLSRPYERMEIIAFDLAEEKFRIVPSPPQPSSVYHSALEVLEGRYLCVMMISTSNENLCSIWVMNQDHRCWTKKYNIAWNVPDNNISLHFYRPLAQSKGGNILLHDSKYSQMKIVSSDLKNTSFDDEDVHVISLFRLSKQQLYSHYYEIIPYTKSFLSLKALGEEGARTGKKTKELKRVRGENNDGEEQPMAEKRNKNNRSRRRRRRN